MPNIRVVTDTGHNLPKATSQRIPKLEVPFYVEAGGESCKDDQLSLTDLAVLMESGKGSYPTTAAPNPNDFEQMYRFSMEFAENPDGILVMTLGAKNSRSYESAVSAVLNFREQTGSEIPIQVIDSRGGTMTQGLLLIEADELIKVGKSLEEIAVTLRTHATGDNLVFACAETTYLYRSGRVSVAKHFAASLLRLKPVVSLVNGKLEQFGRARGQKRAYSMVAEEVLKRSKGHIQKLAIIGGLGTEEGEGLVLEQMLAGLDSEPEIFWTTICAAMGVHSGPHFVGVAWV